ncbi:hypothetical protein [Marixanthomonas spongiae]|uniref:DUF4412 domain-containing protein n=1 Tax=Marixanthomonas spongiae TaxID=2174845 RepID=A0A2U0HWC6_9FLAO|nr:hypothetical protein [Marixanthomonas spongiae]PVW13173.1 hypothetical protein DDV96_13780 [Marixanthomonas spongiae]
MNTFKLTVIVGLFILPLSGQAQFFKKLKEKAENAIERTVLNKTDQEVSKGTNKTIDDVIKKDKKPSTETSETTSTTSKTTNTTEKTKDGLPIIKLGQDEVEVDATEAFKKAMGAKSITSLDDSYTFSYSVLYTMNNGSGGEQKALFFEPGKEYFGISFYDIETENIVLMDTEKQAMFLLVGDNVKTALPIANDHLLYSANYNSVPGKNTSNTNPKIEKLDYKKILGHLCRGYRITTDEGVLVVFIARNTPVQYKGGIAQTAYIPKSLYSGKNDMIMELAFQSNNPNEKPLTMICTNINAQKQTIKPTQYQQLIK